MKNKWMQTKNKNNCKNEDKAFFFIIYFLKFN